MEPSAFHYGAVSLPLWSRQSSIIEPSIFHYGVAKAYRFVHSIRPRFLRIGADLRYPVMADECGGINQNVRCVCEMSQTDAP